ncbi:hypothetical protein [Azospirillum thermophilum]|uniref:DUF3618 domain-containing protein n=1 Tax=Azospirillum thermophilum TaxID=2202148 RepID=A0A2S2CXQ4_9PROT|nr:hypothetical protein [Azospirillum thermophilum]AWK89190.1 hypothetical protein DEW08_24760 [Azospirillum thermophilum]
MAGQDNTDKDGTPPYDALEREIRDSRARIDGTVGALRQRFAQFSPSHLMEHTMNRKHDASGSRSHDNDLGYDPDVYTTSGRTPMTSGRSSGSSMMEVVRSNPIPLAMVGIGLGWLALSGTGYDRRIAHSSTMHRMRDRAGDAAHHARETFYGAAESVRHTAGSAYDRAAGMVGGGHHDDDAGHHMSAGQIPGSQMSGGQMSGGGRSQSSAGGGLSRMQHSTGRWVGSMSGGFWDMVDDHPLVAGVMGVALGAAVAASLPSTRYENRWVGDYADQATERAKEAAMEALDRGTRVAQAAVSTAREEMSDAVAAVGEAAREEANKPG